MPELSKTAPRTDAHDANSEVLVTIVVASYNYEAYLAEAIDSALNQTHTPVEVIVIDDGSKDGSQGIIAGYGNRIRSVLKANEGQHSAYNLGWKMAKGDIVMYLDSDDVLLPDAAKECVRALMEPGVVKAQFLLERIDRDGETLGDTVPAYGFGDPGDVRRDIALWGYYHSPPSSGNAYAKSFLDKILPMPKMTLGDYYMPPDDYTKSLAGLAGTIASIDKVLGSYRCHGKNESDAGRVETLEKLRGLFMYDYIRERLQQQWAPSFAASCGFDRSRFHPTVCKKRFLAYRIEPKGHPIPEDNYWRLLGAGLWGALRFPYLKPHKRAFIFCGFLALAVLPRSVLRGMIGAVSKPEERKGLLRVFRFAT